MAATCQDCGRPLVDPESRAAGRGPICANKYRGSRGTAAVGQLLIFEEAPMHLNTSAPVPVYQEVWSSELPPGGLVCSVCSQPVESEPCPVHAPKAAGR
ncbi:DUF6011 domain-containing protein [Streptomyces sp. PR69]|uniref:DUF6011 domain-containing protein n=1 Tax=Streptomyces sp. PR69 TaxID=2984950 RepID=UPI00226492F2|nr:DUF6011 domain-containing protein [Streptomyces sp. PR69]